MQVWLLIVSFPERRRNRILSNQIPLSQLCLATCPTRRDSILIFVTIVVVVIRTTVTIITKISLFECSVRARKFKKKKKGCCFLELLIWQAEQPNQRKRCCTWMVLAAWYPHCCSPLLHNILCCLPSSCISAWKSSRSPVPALPLSYTAVDTCPYFSVSAPLPVKGAIKLAFAQLYGIFRHWSKGRLYFSTADRLLVVSSFFLLFPSSYLSVTQHPTVLKVHMLEGKKKNLFFPLSVSIDQRLQ